MIICCANLNAVGEHTPISHSEGGTIHHINSCIIQYKGMITNINGIIVSFDNDMEAIDEAIVSDMNGVVDPLNDQCGMVQIRMLSDIYRITVVLMKINMSVVQICGRSIDSVTPVTIYMALSNQQVKGGQKPAAKRIAV